MLRLLGFADWYAIRETEKKPAGDLTKDTNLESRSIPLHCLPVITAPEDAGTYQERLSGAPPLIVSQVVLVCSMVSLMKRTDPSANANWAPPGW